MNHREVPRGIPNLLEQAKVYDDAGLFLHKRKDEHDQWILYDWGFIVIAFMSDTMKLKGKYSSSFQQLL